MNILAFDTTMRACSAAVLRDALGEGALFAAFEARERGHAEALLPMVEQVMDAAGVAYDDLDRLAVTVGPGPFTGVRVGVAAARGLALATGAVVVGATGLEVIAQSAREDRDVPPDCLAVAVDARRGEVYFAMFDRAGAALGEHMALTPVDAAGLLPAGGHVVLAGSGARAVADAASRQGRRPQTVLGDLQPDAATLARMAVAREPCKAPVRPMYLRPPDAKPQTGKRVPRL